MIILEVAIALCFCWAFVTLIYALRDYEDGLIGIDGVVKHTLCALFFPVTFVFYLVRGKKNDQ